MDCRNLVGRWGGTAKPKLTLGRSMLRVGGAPDTRRSLARGQLPTPELPEQVHQKLHQRTWPLPPLRRHSRCRDDGSAPSSARTVTQRITEGRCPDQVSYCGRQRISLPEHTQTLPWVPGGSRRNFRPVTAPCKLGLPQTQSAKKPRIAGLCFIRPWWAHQGSNLGPAD
jgi:hypothetical protein